MIFRLLATFARFFWAAATLWVPPLFFRVLSIVKQRVIFGRADIAGLLSDLFVATAVMMMISMAPLLSRGWLLRLMGTAGLILSFANYEHIRVLGSGLDFHGFKFLGSSQFLRGSIMGLNPFSGSVLAALAMLVLIWGVSPKLSQMLFRRYDSSRLPLRRIRISRVPVVIFSILLSTGTSIQIIRSQGSLAHSWRTYHPLELNVSQAAQNFWPKAEHEYGQSVSAADVDEIVSGLNARDLSGKKFVAAPQKRPNILLVTLEGLSGGYLVSADYSDQKCNYLGLPKFREIARRGIHYSNFVAHNRQTNRGQFSLLCGQYPNLMSDDTKPDVLLSDESRSKEFESCLPSILRKQGYRTDYLQAAELSFMSKDRLMPRLGFETVDGKNWFPHNDSWVGWGPDDRTFLSRSLERIDSLQQSKQPWFLTLMTAGTHHPYAVPEGFSSRYPRDSMQAALELLDGALVEFFDGLEARGILDDTLVIVTSDESSGCDTGSDVQRVLSQAWAPLLIFEPRNHQAMSVELLQKSRHGVKHSITAA
jgi:phosphoglycerol transferase MdoB-like AlkP superfamily enzyme